MALIKKPGRKIWIYQIKINGKSWCRTTGETDKRKAKAKIPQLRKLAQLHRNAPTDSLELKNAIVREVARVETDISKYQAKRAATSLQNFFQFAGNTSLERIDKATVENYQRQRLQKAARGTVKKELNFILRLLRLNGFQVQRPSPKPGKYTPNRAFTKDELPRFFHHSPRHLHPLFATLLLTGARPAELIPSEYSTHRALLKTEVDFKGQTILIRSAKGTLKHTAKNRHLAVPPGLIPLLEWQFGQNPGPFVFPNDHHLSLRFNAILKKAGIEKIDQLGRKLTAHSFRHTYATLMSEAIGHNPFILKELLGHKRIATTEQYCHPTAPVLSLPLDLTVDATSPSDETKGTRAIQKGGLLGWAQTANKHSGKRINPVGSAEHKNNPKAP